MICFERQSDLFKKLKIKLDTENSKNEQVQSTKIQILKTFQYLSKFESNSRELFDQLCNLLLNSNQSDFIQESHLVVSKQITKLEFKDLTKLN